MSSEDTYQKYCEITRNWKLFQEKRRPEAVTIREMKELASFLSANANHWIDFNTMRAKDHLRTGYCSSEDAVAYDILCSYIRFNDKSARDVLAATSFLVCFQTKLTDKLSK